uniref:Micro-fibrillar-associated protein 1 C-terminal domain-containing protein n=1 Tax=Plectus sambesii TaxID=2011161 RepID=A0A914WZC2_9BILA
MGDFVPKFERDMDNRGGSGVKMLPTAGAIPVRNEKGELTMQKVKVTRYMAGKMPVYARDEGSGSEADGSDTEETFNRKKSDSRQRHSERGERSERAAAKAAANDSRYRRLQRIKEERSADDDSRRRHRQIQEPEVVARNTAIEEESSSSEDEADQRRERSRRRHRSPESGDEVIPPEDDDVSDQEDEFERRRIALRNKARQQREEEELLSKQQEEEEAKKEEESEEEETSEEEESESEDDTAPRLKPVFVRKRDRITLQETEKEELRLKQLQLEQDKQLDERKRQSAKLVEDAVKREVEMEKRKQEDNIDLTSVVTDDENEEIAYEAWKVREMKRIKRNRDEREALAKEKAELERVHNMTEEERKAYLRANPKVVTNKADKGRYKFLQKYFHRGAFFLDVEDDVLKRNFAEATLEDNFDKSILPKVMQVKDFGKAGRTKWTHLTSEDTTDHQGAWASETPLNSKFFAKHAAGTREVFERPANKKRKTE